MPLAAVALGGDEWPVIRPAVKDDIPELAALVRAAFSQFRGQGPAAAIDPYIDSSCDIIPAAFRHDSLTRIERTRYRGSGKRIGGRAPV